MINRKLSNKKYREKIKISKREFYSRVGEKCFICGSIKKLVCHQKHFIKHTDIASLTRVQISKEKITNYVRLCYPCHYGVHWIHNNSGLNWRQIVRIFKK